MKTHSFDQLERLFRAASVLTGSERIAFIEAACSGDDELKQELESLLSADEEADNDSFLAPVADAAVRVMHGKGASSVGEYVGPYKLIEPLGEGGMGEVWLAEQKEPIKRQVALKLIKLGMDTKEVVARFESERQALAVMDHPNIAKVLDGGATDAGRPYFVMELVRGMPINEFCDSRKLSTKDRIRLFMDVCQAVQHAHQKGVIHRDLKPTNVLVTVHDDRPMPKVIDFGIAKAIGHNLTNRTLVTSMGQAIGTPAYMSPEQAELRGIDVDTRTDVYSLGVMLYELLVGARPLELAARADQAIREAIRNTEVPKPSTRYTSLGQKKKTIADQRKTTPDQLRRELSGDLDWIVLKSIEKDRSMRYDTVNGLAMELKRYLNNEPIIARPPSMSYRVRKFVRRHRTSVVAASLVFFVLVGGITAASIGLVRAQRAEERAADEALTAQQVSQFMVGLFEVSDPSVARGNSITAREILDHGAAKIETELQDEPEVRAQLLHTIGEVYWALGLERESAQFLQEAIDLRESVLGENHPDVAASLRSLARTRSSHFGGIPMDRREEILGLLHRAREINEVAYGPSHPEVGEDWASIGDLTLERLLREDPRDFEGAIDATEKALAIFEEAYGENSPRVAKILYRLAGLKRAGENDFDEALALYERSSSIYEAAYGPQTGNLLEPLYGQMELEYQKDRNSPDVFNLFERMWALSDESILDSDAYISLFINTSTTLQRIGYRDEAEESLKRAARLLEKKYGPDVEDMIFAQARLIQLYVTQERWSEILPLAERIRPLWERNNRQSNVANAYYYEALALAGLERYDEAESAIRSALEIFEEHSRRYDLTTGYWELARILRLQGRLQEARATEALMREAALEATRGSRARDSDSRFYALALLGCREQWKTRAVMIHCDGAPYDIETALDYGKKAYDYKSDSRQNASAYAVTQYFAENKQEALDLIDEAIALVHEQDLTMTNYRDWRERIQE